MMGIRLTIGHNLIDQRIHVSNEAQSKGLAWPEPADKQNATRGKASEHGRDIATPHYAG